MNSKESAKKKKKVQRSKRNVRNNIKLPLFQVLNPDEIKIKSFTGVKESLHNAIKQSWEMCSHCGQFFTTQEIQEITDGFCPSQDCKVLCRKYDGIALPVERITIYAQMLAGEMFTESLIYYLFFELDDLKIGENARLYESKDEKIKEIESSAPVVMELWRRTGLVWVKRGHGGKFLTWTRN